MRWFFVLAVLCAACGTLDGLSGGADPPPSADAGANGDAGVDAAKADAADAAPPEEGGCTAKSAGPKTPNAASLPLNPAGSLWDVPQNALAVDGIVAEAMVNTNGTTRLLVVTDFGFAVPASAKVTGITLSISRRSDVANEIVDDGVFIMQADVPSVASRPAAGAWTNQITARAYGGPGETWGLTLTGADVDDPKFGVGLRARGIDDNSVAAVDGFSVTVHYCE